MDKIQKIVLVLLFFVLLSAVYTTSNDFSQDLGRHIALGQVITSSGKIPLNNMFSYTHLKFPFINHHWLSEVLFYLLVRIFGLNALIFLKSLLFLVSFWFIYVSSKRQQSTSVFYVITTVLFLPLMLNRLDIRPELFGYLFFALLSYVLFFQDNKKWFFCIPFIMFLWVNMHITFVFGLMLILWYGVCNRKNVSLRIFSLFLFSGLILFLNPNGYQAVFYPFIIFRNYGYSIVENQNMFFLHGATFNPLITYFFLITPVILCSFLILLWKNKYQYANLLLIFYFLSLWQIRHLPFFVIIGIPITSYSLSLFDKEIRKKVNIDKLLQLVLLFVLAIYLWIGVNNVYYRIFDIHKSFGVGFEESQKKATDFVIQHQLPGNIFNNFDIGGYLIYRLYPLYKVFVDNRPEAYPSSFFSDIYIPMQEQQEIRKEIFRKYRIHTIIFSHTDMTPWGRQFMMQMFNDPSWNLVFLNETLMVFTDKTSIPDIRTQTGVHFTLENSNNYISLLQTASVLSVMGKNKLSDELMNKAYRINPNSCTIMRFFSRAQDMNPQFFMQGNLKSSWWCF